MDRTRRRDLLGVIGSLLVIAVTASLIVAVNGRQGTAAPTDGWQADGWQVDGRSSDGPAGTEAVDPTSGRTTLLLQFRADDGSAVGNLLLAGGEQVTMLALPPTLLVPTPEVVPLAQTPQQRDTLAARNGVSSLLGIRLDAVLSVDELALAGLIDAVGGAPLDVPRRFVARDATGAVTLAIFPGARVLPGASAAAYAMGRGDGEPETERMQRLMAVTGQVITALPSGPDLLRALIVSLGASARSTAGADVTSAALAAIRDAAPGGIVARTLPVTDLVGDVSSIPREPEATALVRVTLPGALLAAGQAPLPRIVLRRAGASTGSVLLAQQRLAAAGMAVVAVQATGDATEDTGVVTPNGGAASLARGIEIARMLELPATSVRAASEPPALPQPDALVILGPQAPGIG